MCIENDTWPQESERCSPVSMFAKSPSTFLEQFLGIDTGGDLDDADGMFVPRSTSKSGSDSAEGCPASAEIGHMIQTGTGCKRWD